MKGMAIALALMAAASMAGASPLCGTAWAQQGCCKVCSKGKACGNSCIAKDRKCTKGKGCACNG